MTKKTTKADIWETLSNAPVDDYKNTIPSGSFNADYISWSLAWALLCEYYPDSSYEYTKYDEALPGAQGWYTTGRKVDYLLTPQGLMVECTLTIDGVKYPPMSLYAKKGMAATPFQKITASDINAAKLRCLVKAIGIAGLGLNLYAGEDLPIGEKAKQTQEKNQHDALLKEYGFELDKTIRTLNISKEEVVKRLADECTDVKDAGQIEKMIAFINALKKMRQTATLQETKQEQNQPAQPQQPTQAAPSLPKTVQLFVDNTAKAIGKTSAEVQELLYAFMGVDTIDEDHQQTAIDALKQIKQEAMASAG